jgi:hypothetical protein
VDFGVPEHLKTATAILWMGIEERDVHGSDFSSDELPGTGGCALMECAGLQGDEGRDVAEVTIELPEGVGFGVRFERRLGEASSDDSAGPDEDAAHWRIGKAGWQRACSFGDRGAHEVFELG